MAQIINEQLLMNNSIFQYENRLNSPLARFTDKTPTYVTYYHIHVNETTVDEGFRDIESIISHRSPLRFQKIINFPLYGIEQIVLNLQDQEEGLDSEYTGDAVILPHTLKPLQNDFFMITYLKGSYIFRVTEVQYDAIHPDNYYKINFRFEYNDDTKYQELEDQVIEKLSCNMDNYGTETTCIISDEDSSQVSGLQHMYQDMVNMYTSLFYNERYNCFIGNRLGGYYLFDPLQSVFINKHKLLHRSFSLRTMILSEGFVDRKRPIKYEKSIYRFFERRDYKLVKPFDYNIFPGLYKKDSAFCRWSDGAVYVVDVPGDGIKGTDAFFPEEIVNLIKYNYEKESSKYVELIRKFFRETELISVYDIPLDLNEELLNMDGNEEVYLFTPLLLFIIQVVLGNYKAVS